MAKLQFAFWDGVGGYAEQDANMAVDTSTSGWRSASRVRLAFVPSLSIKTTGGAPAPTVFPTAVARATSTLRIGAMMWQLPFTHCVCAQEVAMLDHLSRAGWSSGRASASMSMSSSGVGGRLLPAGGDCRRGLGAGQQAWTQDEVTTRASTSDSMRRCPSRSHTRNRTRPSGLPCTAMPPSNSPPGTTTTPRTWTSTWSWPRVRPLPPHLARATTQAPCPGSSCSGRCMWRRPMRRPMRRPDTASGAARVGGGRIAQTRIGWGTRLRGIRGQ